jgi:phosphopantothenoylcysteine decarboxylase/phosphopantothenate--cysteine ligase
VIKNATAKRHRKGCDWIVANDVSPETGIMGGSENQVNLITDSGATPWPRLSKVETGQKLAQAIADHFQTTGAK